MRISDWSSDVCSSDLDTLGRAVTDDREAWLADSLPAFLRLNAAGCPAEDWSTAVRHWSGLVDQERSVRQVPRHGLTMTQRLFGGGEIHGDLSPSAFLNVATAIDAWTDDPDPADAPYQRGLGERRADALDDVCRAALDPDDTRWGATADDDDVSVWAALDATDTFDGWAPTDTLDEALRHDADLDLTAPLPRLDPLRRPRRRAAACRPPLTPPTSVVWVSGGPTPSTTCAGPPSTPTTPAGAPPPTMTMCRCGRPWTPPTPSTGGRPPTPSTKPSEKTLIST